ncbi:MAG: acylphosphatase [Candidatus Geothermincolia bacterium]
MAEKVERIRRRVVIAGVVQGVYFRQGTRERALRSGVTGWVSNRSDGKVEAVFEGEEALVLEMVEWCRSGPRGARVDSLDIADEPYTGRYQDFVIARGGDGI